MDSQSETIILGGIKMVNITEMYQKISQEYLENSGIILMSDPEHVILSQKSADLFQKIADLLGPDNEHLLRAYEDTECKLTAILEEYAYKGGFAGGIKSLTTFSFLRQLDEQKRNMDKMQNEQKEAV